MAYLRRNLREKGSQGRAVARAESPDFTQFPEVEDALVVLRVDTLHPGHFDPVRKAHVAVVDVYCSGALKYPWAKDAYFMFPWEYYHYGGHLAEFWNELPTNAGVVDTRFAASRDGVAWHLFEHQAFVRLGMKGEFDSKRIYLAHGVVPAPNERDLFMYYLGTSDTHGWNRDDRNNRLLTAAGVAPTGPNALSRLVLRRGGFVSVRAPYDGGEFTTPPLRFAGDKLLLNVDTSAVGEVRVEIQDETGQSLRGFALADPDIIHTANEIHRVVTWRGGASTLESLAGRVVRLHFVLRDADLYAFQFAARGRLHRSAELAFRAATNARAVAAPAAGAARRPPPHFAAMSRFENAPPADRFRRAAEVIAAADALLIPAGAGIGVDSGLPDFRGPERFCGGLTPR